MPYNQQFKEIKGQTFYGFKIISLVIKRIVFLNLLIICTFPQVKLRILFVQL